MQQPSDAQPAHPLLEELIHELHGNGILVVVQTNNEGLFLAITDPVGRVRAENFIPRANRGALWAGRHPAAQWLHGQALGLFPRSAYARRQGGEP